MSFQEYLDNMEYQSRNEDRPVPKVTQIVPPLREVVCEKKHVVIDSRDRNRTYFPSSNNFRVHFNPSDTFSGAGLYTTDLKNIVSIRLIECLLPNFSDTYSYITLVIPELQDTLSGTNNTLRKAFAILTPDDVNSNFVNCRAQDKDYCYKKYEAPLAKINRLTFEFRAPDGTLVDFGTDTTPPTAVSDSVQVTMVFEFVMKTPNRKQLNSYPVF